LVAAGQLRTYVSLRPEQEYDCTRSRGAPANRWPGAPDAEVD